MLAFLIPALIMLSIFIVGKFAPFGKVSILVADMQYQFVDYIGYLKNVYFGNDDLFYSFSKTFGGDMSGFSAYYLNNPFFLILLLFPNDILPVGIVWMMVVICGGCGLTLHLMLQGIWERRFSSIIFSTAYALMGFMVAYINCIHYFFSVMMLPLVIWGLFIMVRKNKCSLLYVLSAAISIISCYYLGYMILIFTAAFFLYLLFSDMVSYSGIRERIKICWIVLYSTLLAVGISAFSLIAVVLSLQGQKSSGLHMSFARNFNISEFFSGLYYGSFRGNISDGLPIIYCGIATVVFLLLFFFNDKIKIREKIASGLLFGFMILGFWIDALNVAWHGFAHPIGFPYRNSFIFSFLVIFFGYKGFVNIRDGFKKRHANYVMVVLVIYSLGLYLIHCEYVDIQTIIITGIIASISLICIVSITENDKYVIPAIVGLLLIQIFDLAGNGCLSVDAYYEDKWDESVSLATYKEYIDETQSIIDTIESSDTGFYRIDKLYRRTHNDPMMFGYNGLSHFSSCETNQVKEFMGRLGFRDNGNWAYYGHGGTTFADSFMGLRYMISQYDETFKPYIPVYNYNDKYVYQNPCALPLAFTMNNSVRDINMEETNPFVLQNNIASKFNNTYYEIYRPVQVSNVVLTNVNQEDNIYKKKNVDEEAYIDIILSVKSNDFIYMNFLAPEEQDTSITVNGMEKEPYFTIYDWSVRECGYFNPGEEIVVRIGLNQDEIEIDEYQFYYENQDILRTWYKDSGNVKSEVEKITSSHITTNIEVENDTDLVVFTIPYEKDWVIKVDGQKVEAEKVLDALIGIDAGKGKHVIEMRYIPRGLIAGLPISIISFITTFCVVILQKKKKTQNKK